MGGKKQKASTIHLPSTSSAVPVHLSTGNHPTGKALCLVPMRTVRYPDQLSHLPEVPQTGQEHQCEH